MDPITLVMFGLIAVLIFFMFRNGKKRQQAMQELQNGLRPGAEVMLQSGIFGTVESVDDEDNKVTVRSGSSTLVVHRNAVSQITAPVEASESDDTAPQLAPDDDPAFGERISGTADAAPERSGADAETPAAEPDASPEAPKDADGPSDDSGDPQAPKA
ncbi:preprotein translocase subunit YajC [Leucobacter allii]|uniref:preprotein translocase subunit YajC n=1 Tax=Leucobacter allii TaxID=2932247 RepID=UPI001FD0A1C8|nr:preprotein translocase subunit YajC [Leucobacter allii]UOR03222.1 preprotein translocase subunit YajC [Leucobacter allii]